MSSLLDSLAGDPYYTQALGPQTDGTNVLSPTSLTAQPADTGGGVPFNYGAAVLDVFKFGVGAWKDQEQTKQLLDYRRFETTQAGTFQQGKGTLLAASASGGISGQTLLIIGAIVAFALLTHKG